MTRPTQGNGGPDGRPRCYNGEPMREYAANDGGGYIDQQAGADNPLEWNPVFGQKVRRIPWAFSQKCMSWASDPSTDPVPMAENWRCAGCRHLPADLVELAEKRRQEREAKARSRSA